MAGPRTISNLSPTTHALIEHLPVGTFEVLIRPDGRPEFSYVSSRWLEMCGLSREQFMADQGLALALIYAVDRQNMLEGIRRALAERLPFHWEGRLVVRGEDVAVTITAHPYPTADGGTRWEGAMIDITERKRFEAEVVRARVAAEAANQAKSAFLAIMSHEIRTPMMPLIGLAQLALNSGLNATQRDYLDKIDRSARSLLAILNEILDFSKIEAGKLAIERVPFTLHRTVEEVLDLVEPSARLKVPISDRDAYGAQDAPRGDHEEAREDAPEDATSLPQAADSLAGRRILLVEDNAINQQIVCGLLADTGLLIEVVDNGQQAVELFQSRLAFQLGSQSRAQLRMASQLGPPSGVKPSEPMPPEPMPPEEGMPPELILMDIQMPVMDGYEATRQIRALDPHVPIIALTANAFPEDIEKAHAAGMNAHLSKPIDLQRLKALLGEFLRPTESV